MNGKKLKAIRKELGLTQVQLAQALSVSPNTVARWERDELGMRPSTEKLIVLVAERLKKESKEK